MIRPLVSIVALAAALTANAVAATGGKVFVADEDSGTVTVFDASSFRKLGAASVGRQPHNVQVSPDGRRAWVTTNGEPDGNSRPGDHGAMRGEIWALDTETYRVVAKVAVGSHPAHVVLTPSGRFAYVTNGGDNTVSVVDVEAGRLAATIPVGEYPHGLRISPDGREAYVANLKGGTVSVIDTDAMKETARIAVGKGPAQTGFTPDGSLAFVSLSAENHVALIDPRTRKLIRKIPVGTVPIQVHASRDGRWLLVANQGTKQRPGATVNVINLEARRVEKTLKTGRGAHGVAIGADGRYAFVTNIYDNTLSVVDMDRLKVVATVPTGQAPNGISVTP